MSLPPNCGRCLDGGLISWREEPSKMYFTRTCPDCKAVPNIGGVPILGETDEAPSRIAITDDGDGGQGCGAPFCRDPDCPGEVVAPGGKPESGCEMCKGEGEIAVHTVWRKTSLMETCPDCTPKPKPIARVEDDDIPGFFVLTVFRVKVCQEADRRNLGLIAAAINKAAGYEGADDD